MVMRTEHSSRNVITRGKHLSERECVVVRQALLLAVLIVFLGSPSHAYGSQTKQVDVRSKYVYGPGVDNLVFEG